MITRTEAIKNFLTAKTHSDLANLYSFDMECQVNVARDNGERISGEFRGRQWHGWSDGIQDWKSFRIPYNANKNPEYQDKKMTYDLANHAEGIGMTGWDWKNQLSKWVAFDFDAIAGHKSASGLTDIELQAVQKAACNIKWVTVRKSTSGSGIHLYVFLNPVHTKTHTEHGALARAILGTMSALTGFDFLSKVDACGGNMWVWHRKMTNTDGLKLIKEGELLNETPANWKDHVKVISGHRRKNLPAFIEKTSVSNAEKIFEELTGQRSQVNLDRVHKKLIEFLQEHGIIWWWDSDNHMLVTHTVALVNAHRDLGFTGLYSTLSPGTDLDTQNCFCYPLKNGAWVVRRFTPGVQEADTWEQDSNGWTKCYFNKKPDLRIAARRYEGLEQEKGGFIFRQAEMAVEAAKTFDINIGIPTWLSQRRTMLKEHKDGRLIMEIDYDPNDRADDMSGWLAEKDKWKKIFNQKVSTTSEPEVANYDDTLRHVITESGEDLGWAIRSDSTWKIEPLTHVRLALMGLGLNVKEVTNILGISVLKAWAIVNQPFQPEYPGDRKWNRNAAQLRFAPSENLDDLHYPHWNKILNHIGIGLDASVKESNWAQINGIIKGADYLKCWLASIFQEPMEPLPYLFLYGPQNSGKSILHEAISLLLTRGYCRADNSLVNQQGFNGELENGIICIVEETNLQKNRVAYNRIKDWVTSRELPIHKKQKTPYHIPNSTHWIQCANDPKACPIFSGDTRITMIFVDDLDPKELIPKRNLIQKLTKEAPDFIASLIHLELPQSNDRLNIPIITTSEKEIVQTQNQTSLEAFIKDKIHYVPGEMISVAEFFKEFIKWLDPTEAPEWTKIRMNKELPPKFPKGRRLYDGHFYIGNACWDKKKSTEPKLIVKNGKLLSSGIMENK